MMRLFMHKVCPRVVMMALLAVAHLVPAQAQRRTETRGGEVEEFRKSYRLRTDRDARLRMDLDACELRLTRGRSDADLQLVLLYTKNQFTHFLRHDDRNNELEITFDKKGWFEYDSKRMTARLEVELPREVRLRIVSRIKAGEVDMQLGGMHIVEFAFKTWAGEVNIDFEEPNRSEMRILEINTKVGETTLRNLGNARFLSAEINGGIGEMTIDFRGEMLKEASADIDLDIGETVILLPDKSGTKLSVSKFPFLSQVELPFRLEKEGRYYYTKNYRELGRTLQLRVNTGIGELRIE